MSPHPSRLFTPIRIGSLELPARLFKTATAETRATADGYVTDALVAFYRLLARGETPLIITGNIYVSRQGKSAPRQTGADDDDKIPGLARIPEAVHAHGGRIFAQLNHCGRQVVPDFVGATDVVSASATKDLLTGTQPRALSEAEIGQIVEDFGEAARRCREAGFDGVQMHSANGYLMSQFLTPYTNRRGDGYGGEPEARTRFGREVLAAIRARVGDDFPVIIKMNGHDDLPLRAGLKTDALAEAAHRFEAAGVDAVEISVGHYESGFPMVRGSFEHCLRAMVQGSMAHLPLFRRHFMRLFRPFVALACNHLWPGREGFNLDYAPAFKGKLGIPLICLGGFRTRAAMEEAIARGLCDAVSAGRPFLADPFFFAHTRDEVPGPRCVDCNACVGHLGARPADCYHPYVRTEKAAMLARMGLAADDGGDA
ncbi:NADH:flavin oxidoreductase [Nitrogeniibacter mangrovi]|uniref:NADH:flavin oxidoreductase n=1 Tax=Nitrogeniibacter mangrovi TaxID=2016596 RepID=A0A6C1B220_9RHOO|nr:NADH:flavin oxidoreductase [Nitrogeniibacter mangrovi]QID17682.1 NADH:flavin oxidoreductase [Nitrogeniibacter mangrovi]